VRPLLFGHDCNAMEKKIIGEKLHSVILSHCVYTPGIMLEYRSKCRDYMLSMDLGDLVFRTDSLDANVIYQSACSLYEECERHQKHLYDLARFWKDKTRKARGRVIEIVGGSKIRRSGDAFM